MKYLPRDGAFCRIIITKKLCCHNAGFEPNEKILVLIWKTLLRFDELGLVLQSLIEPLADSMGAQGVVLAVTTDDERGIDGYLPFRILEKNGDGKWQKKHSC